MVAKVKQLPNAEAFHAWLQRHTKLGTRALRDTMSRAKRASAFISLDGVPDENQVAYLLKKNPEYQKCSESVRSQLKKAVLLYRKFASSR